MAIDAGAWRARRVLLTGHTGFKGAWLALWLERMGAAVTGLASSVPTDPSLFELARVGDTIETVEADVRDPGAVRGAVAAHAPEVIVHMAAQPFVRRSFQQPRETYETNVMGTVNVLEAARLEEGVRAVVIVTSDKCYDNRDERRRSFVESDPMGGHDPYSSSKGCAELVVDAYRRSFFPPGGDGAQVASVRAGNVIGGGDWGEDRLIPDIVRAAAAGLSIHVRNPDAVRPWQHVLNPLSGYLAAAEALLERSQPGEDWNFGPDPEDVRPVRWIVDRLGELWPAELRWELQPGSHPHEAAYLALDSTKARERLGWAPAWDLEEALRRIVDWHVELSRGGDMRAISLAQLEAFETQAGRVAAGSRSGPATP